METADGRVLAYTSDFSWPLSRVPQNVVLIVDATYGDPAYIRTYSPDDVAEALLRVVRDELRLGPVVFVGHRGRLHVLKAELSSFSEEYRHEHYTACALRIGRTLEHVVCGLATDWGVTGKPRYVASAKEA